MATDYEHLYNVYMKLCYVITSNNIEPTNFWGAIPYKFQVVEICKTNSGITE